MGELGVDAGEPVVVIVLQESETIENEDAR
jgi:hypothetical protein